LAARGEKRRELRVVVDDAELVAEVDGEAALGEGSMGDPRGLLGDWVNGVGV
jgi:hypothetical protein